MRKRSWSLVRKASDLRCTAPHLFTGTKACPVRPIRGQSPRDWSGPLLALDMGEDQGEGRKNVALEGVPSLGGERPAHMAIPHPSDLRVLDIQHRYLCVAIGPKNVPIVGLW